MKKSFQHYFNRDWKNIKLSCCCSGRRDPATVLLLLIVAHSVVILFTTTTGENVALSWSQHYCRRLQYKG
ncbi:hypothetical protein NC653_004164 [Populus alba x Populus x berolinensis]|uniref:Uncharacterized protein n=1 Tax=Populus alba x Populus x berolinensis TaxID=444605 RepID=A0AAD6RTC1_9ROSI|nr:hypothetical protein NC653_004164 [Populus alba x Populus x berolinensis]